jgi:hypothetical protein
MNVTGDAEGKIETYLRALRRRLRGLDDATARDIVDELRSHIVEKSSSSGGGLSAASVDSTLAALGSPEALAGDYLSDELLAQAESSRSPVRTLATLFHWATLSVVGFLVLLLTTAGYLLGGLFILTAALKFVHPQTAGLWLSSRDPDLVFSLRLGFGTPPAGFHEILGWWIVPAGLTAGYALLIFTTRFAIACAQAARRARPLPSR